MIIRIIQSLKRLSPTGVSLEYISFDNELVVPLRRKYTHKYVICTVVDSGGNCLQLLHSHFQIYLNWALGFCCVFFSVSLLYNHPAWTNLGMGCCGKGFIHHSTPPHGTPYPLGPALPQPKASSVLWFIHITHLLPSTPEKQLQDKPGVPAGITWLRRLYLNKDQLLSFIKPHFCSIS